MFLLVKRNADFIVEEKFEAQKPVKGVYGDKYDEDSESSNDEDEDDDGILATGAVDAGISNILQALRSKNPILYDESVTFYPPIEGDDDKKADDAAAPKAQKPMYLSDYHRENLLKGNTGEDFEDDDAPKTFAQEQEHLKKSIVKEMHAAVDESDEDEEGGFLVPKSKPKPASEGIHPSRAKKIKVEDVAMADKDPETFLSNFLSARAWVAGEGARFQPLEEDDDEVDDRAEAWEAAYNLRFENPNGSNEVLKSYARDIIAAKTVRREEPSGRRKQRDTIKDKKEAEKAERDEERARFRRLKIDEMEVKLQKIKKAAGIKGTTLKDDDWTKFLDDGWDDERWEAEMSKKFGEDYYAEQDVVSESDAESNDGASKKKKKVKKPKWDDDIDIKDLVPDFVEDDEADEKPAFTLSDSENEAEDDEEEEGSSRKKSKTSKDRQAEKQAKKKAARLERKKIEELVDSKMDLDLPTKSKQPSLFRYRETSPTSFGLTARDILMAPDTALNQFAGLKKMATFRDVEKKRKDKKYLGKKARLREWRKDTFGNEDGPEIVIGAAVAEKETNENGDVVEGTRKKKRRSRKSKGGAPVVVE